MKKSSHDEDLARKNHQKAFQALFDCKDILVECGEKWAHEADAVNKILADNIPF